MKKDKENRRSWGLRERSGLCTHCRPIPIGCYYTHLAIVITVFPISKQGANYPVICRISTSSTTSYFFSTVYFFSNSNKITSLRHACFYINLHSRPPRSRRNLACSGQRHDRRSPGQSRHGGQRRVDNIAFQGHWY